ncbi:methyltransferase domain-containing protein [Pseudonocardia sp.]|uniref:methyltransferase domain-containing protein n=1 Tax=Pseudonocardia sp. TaxID=60912 RepID=UPI003D0E6EDD
MSAPADYSLGADDGERIRLVAQCAMHRAEAETLLDHIGVGPGWHVLDLGCGPLGILDVLAERVGADGRVVGVDREPRFLDMAVRSLRERAHAGVELVAADARATGLPSAAFDHVHERLVLVNVPDPAAVVAEMARLARPGGTVAVQDVDWISWTCVPGHPDWDLLLDATAGAWSGDVRIGRRLPQLLRDAGLVDVEVAAHTRVFRPGEAYHGLLPRFVELHRDRILAGGRLAPDVLDAAAGRLARHLADPATHTLYATFFQAWGRRPSRTGPSGPQAGRTSSATG